MLKAVAVGGMGRVLTLFAILATKSVLPRLVGYGMMGLQMDDFPCCQNQARYREASGGNLRAYAPEGIQTLPALAWP